MSAPFIPIAFPCGCVTTRTYRTRDPGITTALCPSHVERESTAERLSLIDDDGSARGCDCPACEISRAGRIGDFPDAWKFFVRLAARRRRTA